MIIKWLDSDGAEVQCAEEALELGLRCGLWLRQGAEDAGAAQDHLKTSEHQ